MAYSDTARLGAVRARREGQLERYHLIRGALHPLTDCGICSYLSHRQLAEWLLGNGIETNSKDIERFRRWNEEN